LTRVLVVDDSPAIAELLGAALLLEDYDVRTITTGFTRLLDPRAPEWDGVEVLVCDLMLPESSGLEILSVARQAHPQIRRIALTAIDKGPLIDQATVLAHQVKTKPTPFDDILLAVRTAGR
jgi:DNA-binding response OmpR family regulator